MEKGREGGRNISGYSLTHNERERERTREMMGEKWVERLRQKKISD